MIFRVRLLRQSHGPPLLEDELEELDDPHDRPSSGYSVSCDGSQRQPPTAGAGELLDDEDELDEEDDEDDELEPLGDWQQRT